MRALLLAGGLSLASLALGSLTPAVAHVGHGDEFQQQGNVRQVKASAEIDALMGITSAPASEAGGVVLIPVAAVVEADGKPLAFVKSGTTYDPVFIKTGASRGDQIEVIDGVTAGEDVVIQGALSLYAESKKSDSAAASSEAIPAAAPKAPATPAAAATPTAAAGPNPMAIGAAAAVLVLGGVAVVSRRGKKN
jgi:cation efflux system membrane fusion protein